MNKFSEKLVIKSFAGLKKVAIEPARVTAIIGPQASGKSVTAKLLYFFRGIWPELFYAFEGDISSESRKDRVKSEFKRYFPCETWGDEVFVIQYEIGDVKLQVRRSPSRGKPSEGLILTLPPFCDELFEILREIFSGSIESAKRASLLGRSAFTAWQKIEPVLRERLGPSYFEQQLFIPAGRAFFSNIENNVFSFLSHSERNLDPFLASFGSYFTYMKSDGYRRGRIEYSMPLAKGLLGGTLVVEKDREYVQTSDNRSLPLSNLSSGQQEALPLLMTLEPPNGEIGYGRFEGRGRFATYIEEPEAHLFPDFQRVITEKIAEYAMGKEVSHSVFLTTHSPYVLSTLNNLLMAGRVGARRKLSARVSEVVPMSKWLPKGSVQAYAFFGGECRSLLDDSVGLIDADYLDSVSNGIAHEFEKILEIDSL